MEEFTYSHYKNREHNIHFGITQTFSLRFVRGTLFFLDPVEAMCSCPLNSYCMCFYTRWYISYYIGCNICCYISCYSCCYMCFYTKWCSCVWAHCWVPARPFYALTAWQSVCLKTHAVTFVRKLYNLSSRVQLKILITIRLILCDEKK